MIKKRKLILFGLMTMLMVVVVGAAVELDDINTSGDSMSANITQTGVNRFTIYRDMINNDNWWYFNITSGALNQKVYFYTTTGDPGERYVYSYDDINWHRFDAATGADNDITFSQTFTADTVQVAHKSPYGYDDLRRDIKRYSKSPHASVSILGQTNYSRSIYQLVITNSSSLRNNKATIYMVGRQHPGEPQGSWQLKGLIEFLLNSTNETAKYYRDNYVFVIVPMINVDGVSLGYIRYNPNDLDLNREWNKNPKQTEVELVYSDILNYFKRGAPELMFDYHGFNSFGNSYNWIYATENGSYNRPFSDEEKHSIVTRFFQYSDIYNTSLYYTPHTLGTFRTEMEKYHPHPVTLTLETSASDYSIDNWDMYNDGKNHAKAIDEHLTARPYIHEVWLDRPDNAAGNFTLNYSSLNGVHNITWFDSNESNKKAILVYTFDEQTTHNGTVYDMSPNHYHAVNHNAVWVNTGGYKGSGCFNFSNNGSQYINVSMTSDYLTEINDSFTIELMVYEHTNSTAGRWNWFFGKRYSFGMYAGSSSNKMSFRLWTNDTYGGTLSDYAPITQTWVHYAMRYNGTSFCLYQNGTQHTTCNNVTGTVNISTNNHTLLIGRTALEGQYMNGKIDNFIVHNYALSDKQIQAHAQGRYEIFDGGQAQADETWRAHVALSNTSSFDSEYIPFNVSSISIDIESVALTGINRTDANITIRASKQSICNLTYGSDYSTLSNTIENTTYGTTHNFKISGLTADTTYYFNVTCQNATNDTISGGTYIFTTTDPVMNITSVSAAVTSNSANLKAMTNADGTCNVSYGLNESLNNFIDFLGNLKYHFKTISGLSSDTTYFYNVTCIDQLDNVYTSGTYNFTTSSVEDESEETTGGGGGGGSSDEEEENIINANISETQDTQLTLSIFGNLPALGKTTALVSDAWSWAKEQWQSYGTYVLMSIAALGIIWFLRDVLMSFGLTLFKGLPTIFQLITGIITMLFQVIVGIGTILLGLVTPLITFLIGNMIGWLVLAIGAIALTAWAWVTFL